MQSVALLLQCVRRKRNFLSPSSNVAHPLPSSSMFVAFGGRDRSKTSDSSRNSSPELSNFNTRAMSMQRQANTVIPLIRVVLFSFILVAHRAGAGFKGVQVQMQRVSDKRHVFGQPLRRFQRSLAHLDRRIRFRIHTRRVTYPSDTVNDSL